MNKHNKRSRIHAKHASRRRNLSLFSIIYTRSRVPTAYALPQAHASNLQLLATSMFRSSPTCLFIDFPPQKSADNITAVY